MARSISSLAVTLGLLALSWPVFSGNTQQRAATYSSVCRHAESGDLLGLEVSFVSDVDGGYALVQRYEGAVTPPELMQVKRRGDDLVLASGATDAIALHQDGKRMQVTYLDGQLSAAGTLSDTLTPSSPVWQGKNVAVCN
mgnify:CR=1 FL=1